MKLIFTCGGTAGHINPAIAVADMCRSVYSDCGILFVGAEGMMEEHLVPKAGYNLETVRVTNLSRSLSPKAIAHNFASAKNLLTASAQAKRIIREFDPCAVVGTGGYVCYPVLRAAQRLKIPTALHESNAVPGLTTKMLYKKTDCLMLGFQAQQGLYEGAKRVVFTGTPVREGFCALTREEARKRLGMAADTPFVLSVWGSLGSDYMNGVFASLLPVARDEGRISVLHSAGSRGFGNLMQALGDEGYALGAGGVEVREYIEDMDVCVAACDLVVCRSGASTLAELQAAGKPCILVPSPNVTGEHQLKNARALEEKGACIVMREGTFTAQGLYDRILELMGDRGKLRSMAQAMKLSGKSNASELIAGEVFDLI